MITIIRHESPFCGYRFVLNTNTGEIHDLRREDKSCKIDEIKPEHVIVFDTLERALERSHKYTDKPCNGCAHCLNQYDTDKFN